MFVCTSERDAAEVLKSSGRRGRRRFIFIIFVIFVIFIIFGRRRRRRTHIIERLAVVLAVVVRLSAWRRAHLRNT